MSIRKLLGWTLPKGGIGTNLQNPSDEICRLYIPDEGKIFVQADQYAAEALIVSYLTRHALLREILLCNLKPHVYLGLAFADHWRKDFPFIEDLVPLIEKPREVIKHPQWKDLANAIKDSDANPPATRYYYIYKQTCHSGNYDIKAPTFQLNVLQKSGGKIVLSKKQSEFILGTYRSILPELTEWHVDVQQQMLKTRTIYNLFGHPIYFSGVINESVFKKGYATCPQSTVARITRLAFIELQQWLDNNPEADWDLLNDKHDSILLQCPVGEEKLAGELLRSCLERELINFRGEKFKMKSEVSTGFNWGKAKHNCSKCDEDKEDCKCADGYKPINPNGMEEMKL